LFLFAVVIEHPEAPTYGENGSVLVYEVGHSDYKELTVLEGDEAEAFLAMWEIPVSIPDDEIVAGPFGTTEAPMFIPSYENYRIGSCPGHFETPHEAVYFRLIKDQLHLCPQCDQVIKLVRPKTKVVIYPRATFQQAHEQDLFTDAQGNVLSKEDIKKIAAGGQEAADEQIEAAEVNASKPAKK
jgi:hypothetical protein